MITVLAGSLLAAYTCSVEQPQALNLIDGKLAASELRLPNHSPEDWRFSLQITQERDSFAAEVVWPADPIDVNGRFAAIPTAPGSFAFMAAARGPCLFTEQMCMSLVNVVQTAPEAAAITITPSALAQNTQDKTRSPMIVAIKGSCVQGNRR